MKCDFVTKYTLKAKVYLINIAAVNALVIYATNMRKDQPEKKIKRNDFCSELYMIW